MKSITIKIGEDWNLHIKAMKIHWVEKNVAPNIAGKPSLLVISASSLKYDSCPTNHKAWLDEDSHADMHCAGDSFTVLTLTNYSCDVDPFLSTYDTTADVPVVKAATAVQPFQHMKQFTLFLLVAFGLVIKYKPHYSMVILLVMLGYPSAPTHTILIETLASWFQIGDCSFPWYVVGIPLASNASSQNAYLEPK